MLAMVRNIDETHRDSGPKGRTIASHEALLPEEDIGLAPAKMRIRARVLFDVFGRSVFGAGVTDDLSGFIAEHVRVSAIGPKDAHGDGLYKRFSERRALEAGA